MSILDFVLIIKDKNTGKRHEFQSVPSLPRIGEKIILTRDSVKALTVLSIEHDWGYSRVIIEAE